MSVLLKIMGVLALLYLALLGGALLAMCQPPDTFGKIMAKVPSSVFAILPFKQLWSIARSGDLRVGQQAPDFSLLSYDKKSKVQLSSFRGKKPVVLVFGSYT